MNSKVCCEFSPPFHRIISFSPSFSCRWFDIENEGMYSCVLYSISILAVCCSMMTLCTLFCEPWHCLSTECCRKMRTDGDMGQTQRQVFSVNGKEGVWFTVLGRGGSGVLMGLVRLREGVNVLEEEAGEVKVSDYTTATRQPGYPKSASLRGIRFTVPEFRSRVSGSLDWDIQSIVLILFTFWHFPEAGLHLRRIRRMFSESKHTTWGL